jgi:hypothetical protein
MRAVPMINKQTDGDFSQSQHKMGLPLYLIILLATLFVISGWYKLLEEIF